MSRAASLKGAAMAGAALAVVGTFVADAFVAPSSSTAARQRASAATGAASTAAPQQGVSGDMLAMAAPVTALLGAAALASSAAASRLASRSAAAARRGAPVALSAYDASTQIGVTEPMGFFDPCNFMKDADEATFTDYRNKELKHGRVAMMALVGFLVQPFADSGHIGFSGVPGGVQALTSYPGSSGFGVLFLVAGFFELRILPDMEKEPGNFGDPLKISAGGNIGGYDTRWRNLELNNGRLAMISAVGTITAGFYTGYDAYEQWGNGKGASIEFIKHTLQNAAP